MRAPDEMAEAAVKEIYCTYFDHNYLSRATLMIESLRRYDQSPIYVLALSELCETILHDLALPNVEVIPLATLEAAYPELAPLKQSRKLIEYYFTLSPFLPHYLFAKTDADRITYIDGDLYFFTSPAAGARFLPRGFGRHHAAPVFVRVSQSPDLRPLQCGVDHLSP